MMSGSEAKVSTVKIYGKDYCPYCKKIKEFFAEKGVVFEYVEVTADPQDFDQQKATHGWRTVPMVFIGDAFIGGCDDTLAADASGKLDELLRISTE